MLTFFYNGDKMVAVTPISENRDTQRKMRDAGYTEVNRNEFKTAEDAQKVADDATEFTGDQYIMTDAGRWCYPRYDVISVPQVGAKVSRGFNGDYYPAGEIVKISKTLKKITTSTGATFYRRKQSGSWIADGTWSMVAGHHTDKNPHF